MNLLVDPVDYVEAVLRLTDDDRSSLELASRMLDRLDADMTADVLLALRDEPDDDARLELHDFYVFHRERYLAAREAFVEHLAAVVERQHGL